MNQALIFWPLLAQVALTYAVYIELGRRRSRAVASKEAGISHFRSRAPEPPASAAASANVMNQFELPVLFYAACLASHAIGAVDGLILVLAWVFVASRVVHAFVHLGSNRIRYRFAAFGTGFTTLGLIWVLFALRLAGLG